MEVSFKPKSEVWRGRGHPRRDIPPEVREMADRTYKTGDVGRVTLTPDDADDAAELKRLLKSYAKSLGRRMRIQHDPTELRFEMVDLPSSRKAAA